MSAWGVVLIAVLPINIFSALALPFTCNKRKGLFIPIPTLPELEISTFVSVLKSKLPFVTDANLMSPKVFILIPLSKLPWRCCKSKFSSVDFIWAKGVAWVGSLPKSISEAIGKNILLALIFPEAVMLLVTVKSPVKVSVVFNKNVPAIESNAPEIFDAIWFELLNNPDEFKVFIAIVLLDIFVAI